MWEKIWIYRKESEFEYKQTCHSDLTKNLNESEKKSEYAEKNLNLTIKIGLLYSNLYQIQSQKNLNLESDYLNFTKIQEKIWMIQIKSEWMAGLYKNRTLI